MGILHNGQESEALSLPIILLDLFKLIVDSVCSELELSFVKEAKSKLCYEISLIKRLGL